MVKYQIRSWIKILGLTHAYHQHPNNSHCSGVKLRRSLIGNLIFIPGLQRHIHYICKQHPAVSDLKSTGFVVRKMQILSVQCGWKYRDYTRLPSIQIKKPAKKSGSNGTCYRFLSLVKKWSEEIFLDGKKNTIIKVIKLYFFFATDPSSLNFRKKVLLLIKVFDFWLKRNLQKLQ